MRAAGGLLVLVLLAGCTGAQGSPAVAPVAPSASPVPPGSPVAAADLAPPGGLRVAVEHSETPAGDLVTWESHWVLTWEPVPGAEAYQVWFGTSEGSAQRPRREVPEPRLRLQAAAGTSPRERLEQDRAAGLMFTSSQLLVAVSARAGTTTGPLSPYVPVGDVPPDGVPIPTQAGHGGETH